MKLSYHKGWYKLTYSNGVSEYAEDLAAFLGTIWTFRPIAFVN